MQKNDRYTGAYLGAAIGDAMGGPVEGNHYQRIRKLVGEVTDMLPYAKPYTRHEIGTGFALRPDAGNVTDDTYIRRDLTEFFLHNPAPWTPAQLADWMLKNAHFEQWWPPVIEALRKIERGEVSAEECGNTFMQGGGIGWWTPVGILCAGDPEKASALGRSLCRIWKAPLEQDLLGAVVSGIASGLGDDATYETVIDAMLAQSGPLARALLQRALDVAEQSTDVWNLAENLYATVLMQPEPEPPREVDAPLPPVVTPLPYTDEIYQTCYYAEQIPLAIAAFAFAKGEPRAIPVCCNLGRDCDTNATAVGAWVGALHGISGFPSDWVDRVSSANRSELDILDLANRLHRLYEKQRIWG